MLRIIVLTLFIFSMPAHSITRLKDLITVKGVRENPLIGYGLVIGLNGTGDGGGEITTSSLKRMFQKLGLNPQKEISSKNVAAVIVTTKLPAFARVGQTVDVTVSSIGDSSSLAGGTLLITPLKGGDGHIYAVANGNISLGGLKQGSKHPTTAKVINGASIEREIPFDFQNKKALRFSINRPDFTTAARIEKTINEELGGRFATAKDSTTIDLIIPTNYQRKSVALMAILENLKVYVDPPARIIINERTGTVVAGGNIALKKSAISHGTLTVTIDEGGGGGGESKPKSFHVIDGPTLNDLVKALNLIGATPEDLIAIFQALKKSGSLIGQIEFI